MTGGAGVQPHLGGTRDAPADVCSATPRASSIPTPPPRPSAPPTKRSAASSRAREDADTPDNAVAEQAWRQVARLASRLNSEARAIARTLEGDVRDQRDLVAESLLARPDATTGREAR